MADLDADFLYIWVKKISFPFLLLGFYFEINALLTRFLKRFHSQFCETIFGFNLLDFLASGTEEKRGYFWKCILSQFREAIFGFELLDFSQLKREKLVRNFRAIGIFRFAVRKYLAFFDLLRGSNSFTYCLL